MKKIRLGVLVGLLCFKVCAGDYYQSGTIVNLTATTAGLMIALDSGLPTNCAGSPYGWMLIKQEHTALISTILTAWASGNKTGTVYVLGRENGNGNCLINQFDPVN